MPENDLLMMSLVIFVPSVFALVLMLFPKGTDEAMKWWSLGGTAVTFVISLMVFIDYQAMLSRDIDKSGRPLPRTAVADRAAAASARAGNDDPARADDMVGRTPWIPRFSIEYFLGTDGISMPLVLLTSLLSLLAMIASWGIEKHVRGYCMLFLFLETGMIGTFLALDFFLFYIFWEVMLLPMYFLIGVWGGPRREYAAIKFFLYTLLGSVFILIAMLGFYFADTRDFVSPEVVQKRADELRTSAEKTEYHTFDLTVLAKAGRAAMDLRNIESKINSAEATLKTNPKDSANEEALTAARDERTQLINTIAKRSGSPPEKVAERLDQPFFSATFQIVMFLLLFVGFAIKVPVFPFHTWLPDAHVEAPTPISMILAGVLLKMGGYGILRIAYPICPWAAYTLAWYLAAFGVINIVYGAFAAMAQTDFKRLVAYSSISHMGYVILGIAVWSASGSQYWSWGMNGAMYQMLAHGISSAGMFFLVGVLYDRAHHRNLDNFRGLYEPMPLYGGISAIIFFAALGLPGLCGFVGEFMVILSTWNFAPPEFPLAGRLFAVLAALTVVITAAYILWTLQRVFLGTNPAYKDFPDINLRELIIAIPLVVLAFVLGVAPALVFNWMEPHVTGLVDTLVQATR